MHPASLRGASAIVTIARRGCGGRRRACDEARGDGRPKSRSPGAPPCAGGNVAGRLPCPKEPDADVAPTMVSQTKWPITRGFAKQAVTPSRAERRLIPVNPLNSDALPLPKTASASGPCYVYSGASGTRRSARPLNLGGVDVNQNSGASRRENAKPYLQCRGCLTIKSVKHGASPRTAVIPANAGNQYAHEECSAIIAMRAKYWILALRAQRSALVGDDGEVCGNVASMPAVNDGCCFEPPRKPACQKML